MKMYNPFSPCISPVHLARTCVLLSSIVLTNRSLRINFVLRHLKSSSSKCLELLGCVLASFMIKSYEMYSVVIDLHLGSFLQRFFNVLDVQYGYHLGSLFSHVALPPSQGLYPRRLIILEFSNLHDVWYELGCSSTSDVVLYLKHSWMALDKTEF